MKRPNNRLFQAEGDFMRAINPTWWATLTFRIEVDRVIADRTLRLWLRGIAQLTQRHFDVAWAVDLQDRGVLHHHARLALDTLAPFDAAAGTRLWKMLHKRAGGAKIEPFDPTGGAPWYQAKHMEWDRNRACPRTGACRRSVCVEAPGPW